ncbi:uncharacterized protein N7459_005046 [Penicillium hispanicum]|uniref:uncharacterized protein n=1 Tax=Penicillium hispanicum TaxID=1080232 RepID=UPI002542477D|nr:uncharacterized protein N7459_005046 [Penicillium hispanicum]KAJ5585246.1 hypothetical protein N7459_005046 [Penicillium hispanicum]
MSLPTYTIDPDGEVIIILRNANSPFAQLAGSLSTRDSNTVGWFFGNTESPRGVTGAPESSVEEPELSPKEKRKKRKEKKRKSRTILTALESTLPNEEPIPAESAATEYPVEEEPTTEEAAEEPAPEASVAAEYPADKPAYKKAATEGNFAELEVCSCFRIQVSAKHLMFSSPVFKRILAGGWKESITYFQKGSVEVTAESWDIEALMILLKAIHGQFYHIPKKLSLEMLAKVAVIADYYDCKEALHFLKDMWITNTEEDIPTTASRDLILWLWIAWFFQLPSEFKSTTSIAMSQSDDWIDMLGLPVPDNVIGSMNECREKAINDLIVLLYDTRDAFLRGSRGCCFECRSIMYGGLTLQMQSNNLLLPKPKAPFPNLNYNHLVRTVMKFTSPRWYNTLRFSIYEPHDLHNCSDASFKSMFVKLADCVEGLELEQLTD